MVLAFALDAKERSVMPASDACDVGWLHAFVLRAPPRHQEALPHDSCRHEGQGYGGSPDHVAVMAVAGGGCPDEVSRSGAWHSPIREWPSRELVQYRLGSWMMAALEDDACRHGQGD